MHSEMYLLMARLAF